MYSVNWFDNHENTAALYDWLVESGRIEITYPSSTSYLLHKPWKWNDEWNEMQADMLARAALRAVR